MGVRAAAITALLLALPSAALAIDKPEYADVAPEIRAWYRNAELTEAARRRLSFTKCCDHADVVKTRFRVSKATGGDEWYYLDQAPDGTRWKRIPDDVIHWGKSAPGGQPTLFVFNGTETCFFPGDGGI